MLCAEPDHLSRRRWTLACWRWRGGRGCLLVLRMHTLSARKSFAFTDSTQTDGRRVEQGGHRARSPAQQRRHLALAPLLRDLEGGLPLGGAVTPLYYTTEKKQREKANVAVIRADALREGCVRRRCLSVNAWAALLRAISSSVALRPAKAYRVLR